MLQEWVAKREENILDPRLMDQNPHFEVRDGIIYQVERRWDGELQSQILVFCPYWTSLLQVAHILSMGVGGWEGYLGQKKTEACLANKVFWPRIYKMIKKHCWKCPACQKTVGMKPLKAPLMPLPVAGRPFDRIALDIARPFPCSHARYQFLLVS